MSLVSFVYHCPLKSEQGVSILLTPSNATVTSTVVECSQQLWYQMWDMSPRPHIVLVAQRPPAASPWMHALCRATNPLAWPRAAILLHLHNARRGADHVTLVTQLIACLTQQLTSPRPPNSWLSTALLTVTHSTVLGQTLKYYLCLTLQTVAFYRIIACSK